MKKLAIMFVMLLGSVATMQAQSFDFSCDTIDNSGITPSTTSILMDGFTPAQMVVLEDDGYTQSVDENGDEVLTQTFSGASIQLPDTDSGYAGSLISNANPLVSVQVGNFYDERDDSAVALGPFVYRVIINDEDGGRYSFVHFFNNVDVITAFLLTYNTPYVAVHETLMNAGFVFVNSGSDGYFAFLDTDGSELYSIAYYGGALPWVEEVDGVEFLTLQEAMDYVTQQLNG